jgi:hypothetical protein
MEMLLMGVCVSLLGLAVACLAFGAATRSVESAPAVAAETERVKPAPARFFTDAIVPPVLIPPRAQPTQVPIEALLLQIENHVRLEHAAAESFLASPNSALLHSRTTSPLVH